MSSTSAPYRLDTFNVLSTIKRYCPTEGRYARSRPWLNLIGSPKIWSSLDKVDELGKNNDPAGHSGCVNALHWSADGSVLLSAGDDTRVHVWQLNPAQDDNDYPLTCTTVLETGHTNNIFNVQILGTSSRIATCAADRQVRVFDINRGDLYGHKCGLTKYTKGQGCIRTFKCHRGPVKRIITEHSPDYFLTVSEDGTVRQHDLRTPHRCSRSKDETCPSPLSQLPFELSTIALSLLTPYNFVVAGDSPYAYLFDRRQAGRRIKEEWGEVGSSDGLTSCVRRFGRKCSGKKVKRGEHITGSRMSHDNGHELLLSYSGDAVYLYSTRDSPTESSSLSSDISSSVSSKSRSPTPAGSDVNEGSEECLSPEGLDHMEDEQDAYDEVLSDSLRLPIVLPRRRYRGACNVHTFKDVNFVGPRDEYVVSGSDDGNFFIWNKLTGCVQDILEGDESIVNVIEQHPSLPILAVSGIDATVKIFSPSSDSVRSSSRISQKEEIMQNNMSQGQSSASVLMVQYIELADLYSRYRVAISAGEDPPDETECVHQ